MTDQLLENIYKTLGQIETKIDKIETFNRESIEKYSELSARLTVLESKQIEKLQERLIVLESHVSKLSENWTFVSNKVADLIFKIVAAVAVGWLTFGK